MSLRAKHRLEFGTALALAAVLFLAWRGNKAVGRTGDNPLSVCGGRISAETREALETLAFDLRDAKAVSGLSARHVRLTDRNGLAAEYRFSESVLWKDLSPLARDLSVFHFEFRDAGGNLLTPRPQNLAAVHSVGYTARIRRPEGDVFASASTHLHRLEGGGPGTGASRVLAYTEARNR